MNTFWLQYVSSNQYGEVRRTTLEDLTSWLDEGGVATAGELTSAGFSPGLVAYALERGLIGKVTRGVYCSADVPAAAFAAVCLRWRKCVLSLGSALYLRGLSDRVPARLDVTVPHGYNPRSLSQEFPGTRIHRASPELWGLGRSTAKTPSGVEVPCQTAERAVAGLIAQRAKRGADAQLVRDVVAGYFKRPGRDLPELSRMCAALGVADEFQTYLEVLS